MDSLPILLLEDEPLIAVDIEDLLHQAGFEFETFSTCADADRWLEDNTPKLAIVDPHLKDGLCAQVVETLDNRGVPFIVYSGNSSTDEYPATFSSGTWILKPADPDVIRAALLATIAGGGTSNQHPLWQRLVLHK